MISFESVSLSFGERAILTDSTFTFEQNTVYILRGPSGIGKSSVLHLVAGYVPPTAGAVRTDGTVEYLMQDELLFSELTVAANLRIRASVALRAATRQTREQTILDALDRLGLADRALERVGSLSGGERRRVELAGTLLRDPAVLLLDEPVANLDAATASEVYSALWTLRHGRTLIVVTHEPNPATPEAGVLVTITEGALSTT